MDAKTISANPGTLERTATFASGDPGAVTTCTRSVFSPSGRASFRKSTRR